MQRTMRTVSLAKLDSFALTTQCFAGAMHTNLECFAGRASVVSHSCTDGNIVVCRVALC